MPNKLQCCSISRMDEFTCMLPWINIKIPCDMYRKGKKQLYGMELQVRCAKKSQVNKYKSPRIRQRIKIFYFIAVAFVFQSQLLILKQVAKCSNYRSIGGKKSGWRVDCQHAPPFPQSSAHKHPPTMPKVKSFSQVQRSSKSS